MTPEETARLEELEVRVTTLEQALGLAPAPELPKPDPLEAGHRRLVGKVRAREASA